MSDLMVSVEEFRKKIGMTPVVAADVEEEEEPLGEYKAAEYIIFSLALETYLRHLGETVEFRLKQAQDRRDELLQKMTFESDPSVEPELQEAERLVSQLEALGDSPVDKVSKMGIVLLRRLDQELESLQSFIDSQLERDSQKKMLDRTFRRSARNAQGAERRALGLRTLLRDNRVVRGVFESAQARKQVKTAIAAQMMSDGDAALDLFAAMPASVIKNPLIRKWIKLAADTAKPLPSMTEVGLEVEEALPKAAPNPIVEATSAAVEQTPNLMAQQAKQEGATGVTEVQDAQAAQGAMLQDVQQKASEAARQTMERQGEPDIPPAKSEVVGIATAAAVAAMSDPANPQNIPETLKKLDPEQRAAAVTDGRVLVAAGAGSGKSTTLVARVNHLVRDRGVPPSRILVTSFNTSAAEELKVKLGKAAGGDAASSMQVGTMHSLFKRFLLKYGNAQEKQAMRTPDPGKAASLVARTVQGIWGSCFDKDDMPTPPLKEVKQQMELWVGNNISVAEAKATAKNRKQVIAAQWYEMYEGLKGALPGWEPPCEEKARNAAEEEYQEKYRRWEAYGGRGRPPQKPMTSYEWFMSKARPNGERVGDFNDMIRMFRDLLKRNPAVRKEVQSLFDHIAIDECVHEDTEVVTLDGPKRIADIQIGEEILSFRNGSATFKKVLDKRLSDKTMGIMVRTASGRQLAMTHNHRLYASFGDVPEGFLALYLMYRRDKGFRIGTSEKPIHSRSGNAPRPNAERADALWILEVGEPSEILFKEQATSLRYRVPTYIFEGTVRGCDQERIDRIFEEFGNNGKAVLAEYGLDFHYPHWVNSTYTGGNHDRKVLTIQAHRSPILGYGTSVSMSWSGDTLEDCDLVYDVKGGRKLLIRRLSNYAEARKFAVDIANKHGVRITETLPFNGGSYTLTTAGSLMLGAHLPVWVDGWAEDKDALLKGAKTRALADKYHVLLPARGSLSTAKYNEIRRKQLEVGDPDILPPLDSTSLASDEVVEILPTQGVFYDITVEETGNFFANGILSHNCQDLNQVQFEAFQMMTEHIGDGSDGRSVWMVGDDRQSIYGFRGARPDLFQGLYEKEGWTTRMIRTNYRCAPEIVDHANRLIAHNERQIPIPANAAPGRAKGVARLEVTTPADAETGAIETVKRILEAKASNPMTANSEFAVLARTNKELHAYEAACLIQGIPYARKGASSFLGTPEVKGMLGYVDLVMGTDNEKLQKSLADVINIPRRFWGLDMEQSERAVKDAIRDYARKMRIDPKAINPVEALRDRSFQEMLGQRLGAGPSGSAKYKDVMSQLETLIDFVDNMQASSAQPGFEVKDLFNEVLLIEGKVREINPDTGRAEFKTRTFRDSIQVSTRDRDDGDEVEAADDEEGEDTSGLGNISFLYELAKVDPNNPPDLEEDPSKPGGFLRKMDQLREKAKDLRINVEKWNAEQRDVPPDKRVPPPGVYLGTAHCSPADEPVLTTEGYVPIGDLDPDRHRLASYLPTCNQLFWGRIKGYHEGPDGYGFQKSSRPYQGPLLTLTTDRSRTRVTPDHKLRVKFADNFFNKWVVYLMRRGDWWRVGMCRSANRPYKSGDLGCRLSTEKADGGWILKVCETREETIAEEARIQGIYGIPGLTFEASKQRTLTSAQLHVIHEKVKSQVGERVSKLLSDFGLDAEHPLYIGGSGRECDKRSSFTTQARNCLSGYMTLPVVSEAFVQGTGHREIWTKPEWHEVQVTTEQFEGDVYSLVVAPHRFYVSGGAVVHNSVKGAEWPTVFVQMPAGKFPMEPRRDPKDPPPTEEELAEQMEQERRLAYVALTRAATNLSVVCPRKIGNAGGISSFVEEAGLSTYMVSPPKPESAPPPPESAEPEVLAEPEAVLKEASQWNPFEDGAHWDPFGE